MMAPLTVERSTVCQSAAAVCGGKHLVERRVRLLRLQVTEPALQLADPLQERYDQREAVRLQLEARLDPGRGSHGQQAAAAEDPAGTLRVSGPERAQFDEVAQCALGQARERHELRPRIVFRFGHPDGV